MGMLSAMAMQDEELGLTLEQQIGWHFSSNCYPPVPGEMIPTAIYALDLVNAGEGDRLIQLPEGVQYRGSDYVSGWDAVESWHLGAWVIESELY